MCSKLVSFFYVVYSNDHIACCSTTEVVHSLSCWIYQNWIHWIAIYDRIINMHFIVLCLHLLWFLNSFCFHLLWFPAIPLIFCLLFFFLRDVFLPIESVIVQDEIVMKQWILINVATLLRYSIFIYCITGVFEPKYWLSPTVRLYLLPQSTGLPSHVSCEMKCQRIVIGLTFKKEANMYYSPLHWKEGFFEWDVKISFQD